MPVPAPLASPEIIWAIAAVTTAVQLPEPSQHRTAEEEVVEASVAADLAAVEEVVLEASAVAAAVAVAPAADGNFESALTTK